MPVLLASIHAVWLFLAGVSLLTFILMKRAYRYFGKPRRLANSAPIDLQPRPQGPWDGAQRDTLAHVERQKVEMYELARDLNGQLSTKMVVLERLIAESQQQIDRLEKLVAKVEPTASASRAGCSLK